MTPELKERWIEALGTYPKGVGYLENEGCYCCLGVLADIEGDLKNNKILYSDRLLHPKYREKYGLDVDVMDDLMRINDHSEDFDFVIETIKREL